MTFLKELRKYGMQHFKQYLFDKLLNTPIFHLIYQVRTLYSYSIRYVYSVFYSSWLTNELVHMILERILVCRLSGVIFQLGHFYKG